MSSQIIGRLLEDYISDVFSFYTIIREKDIRKKYSYITTIDLIIQDNNDVFLIQCKYLKTKPQLNDVKSFMNDCNEYINKEEKYNYHLVFLSNTEVTLNGENLINNFNRINQTKIMNIHLDNCEKKESNLFYLNEPYFRKLAYKLYLYIVSKTKRYNSLKEFGYDEVLMIDLF